MLLAKEFKKQLRKFFYVLNHSFCCLVLQLLTKVVVESISFLINFSAMRYQHNVLNSRGHCF